MFVTCATVEIGSGEIKIEPMSDSSRQSVLNFRFSLCLNGEPAIIEFPIDNLESFSSWDALYAAIILQVEGYGGLACFGSEKFEVAFKKVYPLIALCWDAERCFSEPESLGLVPNDSLIGDIEYTKIQMVALRYKLSRDPEVAYYGRQLMRLNRGHATPISERMCAILSSHGDLPELCGIH